MELLSDSGFQGCVADFDGHGSLLGFGQQRAPGLETIFQNLLHFAAALEDSDYVQRLRVGPVDDEIRIDWQELHRFVCEILAPVTDAWAFGQHNDLVANNDFNSISDLLGAFSLDVAPDLD